MGGSHSVQGKTFERNSRLHDIAVLSTAHRDEIKLLRHEIHKKNSGGYTPLALACYTKATNIDNVYEMLMQGADPDTGKGSQGVVLHFASRVGRIDIVKVLLANGADPNSRKTQNADPVIKFALNVEICKLLIASGANVNQRNYCAWSALHFTPVDGRDQLEVAKFLIANGFSTEIDIEKQRREEDLDPYSLKKLSETAMIGDDVKAFFEKYEANPIKVKSSLSHLTLSPKDLDDIRQDIYKQSRHYYFTQNPSKGDPQHCFDVRNTRVIPNVNDIDFQFTDDEDEENEEEEEEEDDDGDDKVDDEKVEEEEDEEEKRESKKHRTV